jgi:hypothetical protein
MEQVAIITQLVQDMIAMNCGEREMAHFILNLDTAVKTLTYIKEDTPRQMARDWKREAGRAEREAKEAKEKEEKRLIQERQEEYKKEKQRQRRRELYQLKKMKAKVEEHIEAEPEDEGVIECFYICRYCRASYSNGEVDCFDCENVGCCYLYQAETYEKAVEMSHKQFN